MNAVLDQIEEPELLLKQAIRDMQEMLDQDEQQIKLKQHEQQQLTKKKASLDSTLDEIETQLPLCFQSEKENLARSLVKRKLEAQQNIKAITQKYSTLEESMEKLISRVKEQQSQLENMQQKAEIFGEETLNNSAASWDNAAPSVQDDDIEIAFLHEKQKWSTS
jgi:phage shock protein A